MHAGMAMQGLSAACRQGLHTAFRQLLIVECTCHRIKSLMKPSCTGSNALSYAVASWVCALGTFTHGLSKSHDAGDRRANLVRGIEAEAAGRQPDHGFGHHHTRCGNAARHVKAGGGFQAILSQRSTRNGHQGIDGHGLWVGREGSQLMDETNSV